MYKRSFASVLEYSTVEVVGSESEEKPEDSVGLGVPFGEEAGKHADHEGVEEIQKPA